MMKFKQRVVAVACAIIIGLLYSWSRSLSQQNPVVEVDDEALTLLLDKGVDFDKIGSFNEARRVSSMFRRSRMVAEDSMKNTKKPADTVKISTSTSMNTTDSAVGVAKPKQEELVLPNPWEVWNGMVTASRITPNGTLGKLQVNAILKALRTSPIIKVGIGFKGSQLKASMFLQGYQRTVFKPKRYERDFIIRGKPYDGYDRHNGEIAAFHLDRLLGFNRAPLVSGRIVNLKTEILPVTDQALKNTFFTQGNDTCFYGVCYYCKREEPACANGDIMEGSVTLWLPKEWKLVSWKHPWMRTYSKRGRKAGWETDELYCDSVKKMVPYNKGPRLTSIIDTAVFDFLIGNADRHHYETFQKEGKNGLVLHLDNGKSFGNPEVDEISILAPLYQCCRILRSTWVVLNEFHKRKAKPLSEMLKESMSIDPLTPVLTQSHLDALDRRLEKILEVVQRCISKNSEDSVLVPGWSL